MIHLIPDTCGIWLKLRDLPPTFFPDREAAIRMVDFYWVYICPLQMEVGDETNSQ